MSEDIALWPDGPPDGVPAGLVERIEERVHPAGLRDRLAHDVTRPLLTLFRPAAPTGAALLIIPGGGYTLVAVDVEGLESGERWAQAGVTSFVLRYRLPSDGWRAGPETPLQDAQRAVRLIRARARRFGVDPARVAVVGFSAGGHLAGSLATRFDERTYAPVDAADRLSARPAVVGLVYPVVTMRSWGHAHSRDNLLGAAATTDQIDRYSLEVNTPDTTPPTVLIHAADDDGVTVDNSTALFSALRAARVSAALHVFDRGGHGFGLRGVAGRSVASWPNLFDGFAREHGVFAHDREPRQGRR